MVAGFRQLTLSDETAINGMCFCCMENLLKGIARKYYVSPGLGSVSLSPFSNIVLHRLSRFVFLPLMKDGHAPTELEETRCEKEASQDASHFNP
jgi:hypothetical protein